MGPQFLACWEQASKLWARGGGLGWAGLLTSRPPSFRPRGGLHWDPASPAQGRSAAMPGSGQGRPVREAHGGECCRSSRNGCRSPIPRPLSYGGESGGDFPNANVALLAITKHGCQWTFLEEQNRRVCQEQRWPQSELGLVCFLGCS